MGKKRRKYKGKEIDFTKVELTEKEEKEAAIKAKSTIALSIFWPLTLFILWPNSKNYLPIGIYYLIILISGINIVLTFYYSKSTIEDIKYEAYLRRNRIGKFERYSSFYVILEVALILIYSAMYMR